jgi:hypothetical protein
VTKKRRTFLQNRYTSMRSTYFVLFSRLRNLGYQIRRLLRSFAGVFRGWLGWPLLWCSIFIVIVGVSFATLPSNVKTSDFWFASAEDVRTLILLVASVGGAVLAIVGVWLSHRRAQAATKQSHVQQENHFTDLLLRATEQLSNNNLLIRLVGVNALERLARDSAIDRSAVVELLAQFLQTHLPVFDRKASQPFVGRADIDRAYISRGDVASAARVLAYVTALTSAEGPKPVLNSVYFPSTIEPQNMIHGWIFRDSLIATPGESTAAYEDCEFDNTDFIDCNMNVASFVACRFSKSSFPGTRFPSATFEDCTFEHLNVFRVYFGRSRFIRCSFMWSYFGYCTFHFGDFDDSSFVGTTFNKSNFSGAYLENCGISDVKFSECSYHPNNPPYLPDELALQPPTFVANPDDKEVADL